MEKIPAQNYLYAHGKSKRIFADIPQIGFMEVTPQMDARQAVLSVGNNLFINTWIGRDGRYVLPGIGCVVEKLYEMYNDILRGLGIPPLGHPVIDYIPTIDFSYYDIDSVDDFIKTTADRKILISNGPVQSCQAENFDFTPVISRICDMFPQIVFIVTQPVSIDKCNLIMTSDIIKSDDGFDLNEIAYLSLFTDTIIGRNSGPHVFAQNRQNWDNPQKASLSFTYTEIASHFVLDTPVQMKKYWSCKTDEEGVVQVIKGVLER